MGCHQGRKASTAAWDDNEIGETYRPAGSKFEQLRAGVCASACAYSFLGGTDRSLLDGSMIGFHQFHSEQSPEVGISPAISEASGISQAQLVMGIWLLT
jgi:Predicted periplasmic protein